MPFRVGASIPLVQPRIVHHVHIQQTPVVLHLHQRIAHAAVRPVVQRQRLGRQAQPVQRHRRGGQAVQHISACAAQVHQRLGTRLRRLRLGTRLAKTLGKKTRHHRHQGQHPQRGHQHKTALHHPPAPNVPQAAPRPHGAPPTAAAPITSRARGTGHAGP